MDKIRIRGGSPLIGEVKISGAKNSTLPCMAAALMTSDAVQLHNVPRLARDITTMKLLLEHLGINTAWEGNTLQLQSNNIAEFEAPYDMVKTMRASVMVLGPLVSRFGKAIVSLPGGCAIGARPIDMHLKGLEQMGAGIKIEHGYVFATASRLRGARYKFPKQSVTGTENLVIAASLADGETILENCAMEPEVGDVISLLRKMGARIEGENTTTLRIQGVDQLHGAEHTIIPDRIEAGTFLMAGAITSGDIHVRQCNPDHLGIVIAKLRENGCKIDVNGNQIRLRSPEVLSPSDVETHPYPKFATDLQAQYMAVMTQAQGASRIYETIFENRFMHVGELLRMGADIRVNGRVAEVRGKTPLSGANVMATDLRASASLILAGLVADGDTIIQRVYHIDRGYEKIEEKLRNLGADVERVH